MDRSFLGCGPVGKFAGAVLSREGVADVSDDRLKMLKWQHLKVELDDREKQWPEHSSYEFDHDKQTVTWLFGGESQTPEFFVWHLTDEEIASPKPAEVANRIIRQVNKVAESEWHRNV